jgi:LysM repeat protein
VNALARPRPALKAPQPDLDAAARATVLARQAPSRALNFCAVPVFSSDRPNHARPPQGRIQAKLAVGRSSDPLEGEADRVAAQVVRMPDGLQPVAASGVGGAASGPDAGDAPPVVHDVLRSPGQSLDGSTRAFFEPRFGRDFSQVRVHADERAARSARAIGATAYTAAQSIVFGQGAFAPATPAGRHLLAHELAHFVQQSGGGGGIQRFEAGEHAQFGETGNELKALINAPAAVYVVKDGDTPESIAADFKVPRDSLLERNKAKIKPVKHKVRGKKDKMIKGFRAGETIDIPQVLNQPMQDALTVDELSYEAGQAEGGKRATLKYGEGIAMGGDMFADPGQIDATPKSKLENLQSMIQGEKTTSKTGTFVETEKWEKATDKRFAELAKRNESHFAPSDASLATPAGTGGADHKSVWEKYHASALTKSQAGDRDQALEINAFADHFLTDAFSAGHLINKPDVAAKFKGSIATIVPDPNKPTKREIAPGSKGFFDQVAQQSFVGPVRTEFSKYETVEKHWGFHPNIDSVSRFSDLLQGVYLDPVGADFVLSSIVKVAHDDLSTKAGGISVENQKGDKWQLPGDKTLNASTVDPKDAAKTLEVGHKAVAQSQYNVLSVFQTARLLDLPKLFKAVWDYVPRPTGTGAAVVKAIVDTDTDPTQGTLIAKLAKLVRDEYKTILQKLVDLKQLKKA